MRMKRCACCREPFTEGYALGVLVSTIGASAGRRQKYRPVVEVCRKCGNAPGGRRTRRVLWMGLRDGIRSAIAQIENVSVLLTTLKNDASSILTGR